MNIALHHIHNLLRWGVLIAGIWSIWLAYTGVSNKRNWEGKDNKAGMWFILFCHLQVLIGLVLYFYLGQNAIFSNMAEGMKNPETRFWGVEHIFGMIVAVALIQYGRIASKKAATDQLKHKKALIWFSVGLAIILLTIPWPWTEFGRALFPGM